MTQELAVTWRTALPMLVPALAGGVGGVAAGVAGGLHGARLLLAAVGLLILLVTAVALLRPPTLVLDGQGLALRTPLGERWRLPWSDCGEFRTYGADLIVWTSAREAVRRPRVAAAWQRRAQADTAMRAQFGGLSSSELADLLNRYRGGR